jgi:hypothetical protein
VHGSLGHLPSCPALGISATLSLAAAPAAAGKLQVEPISQKAVWQSCASSGRLASGFQCSAAQLSCLDCWCSESVQLQAYGEAAYCGADYAQRFGTGVGGWPAGCC